jgi:hypothetical protein
MMGPAPVVDNGSDIGGLWMVTGRDHNLDISPLVQRPLAFAALRSSLMTERMKNHVQAV